MLESFIAGTPRVVASVEIGRRDGWTTLGRGEGREVSIMSASVRGLIVHHGIRCVLGPGVIHAAHSDLPFYSGLVTRFPLASAFIASFTFLMIMLSILSACILPTVLQRRLTGAADNIPIDGSTNSPPIPVADISSTDGDEKIPRRRRSRPSRSSTRRTVSCPTASDANRHLTTIIFASAGYQDRSYSKHNTTSRHKARSASATSVETF